MMRLAHSHLRIALFLCWPLSGLAQTNAYWLSGQINFIQQWHGPMRAKYSGTNSLRARRERATSRLLTLYTGLKLARNTELIADLESAGGNGISDAFGLAGFTNLDIVRNPTLRSKPYVARLMLRQIIPLSDEMVTAARGPLSLADRLPARRLEIRMGKFGMVDFFDLNSVGSDSHLQFLNWTVDNNGGYDYAADTRGYTYGVLVEYWDHGWALRFAEGLMPKIANGIALDWRISRARAENAEIEFRGSLLPNREGAVRALAYRNHANMGSYREAIDSFLKGAEPVPQIEAHRRQGRVKYGFGINFEQEITAQARLFGRAGWNEGRHESFAYTEVNQSAALGGDLKGERWRRKQDKLGVAVVANAISGDHRRYLALGGLGFLLGDGALNYGPERIIEGYYTLHIGRGLSAAFDLQRIANPGYNRDRGPVLVPSVRLHLDWVAPFSQRVNP